MDIIERLALIDLEKNTQKYWVCGVLGNFGWVLHGRLSDDLSHPKTRTVWTKRFRSEEEARSTIKTRRSKKIEEGYGPTGADLDSSLGESLIKPLVMEKLKASYALRLSVPSETPITAERWEQAASSTTSLIQSLSGSISFLSSATVTTNGKGTVTISLAGDTIETGIVPKETWEALSKNLQDRFRSDNKGIETFLNPMGTGSFMLETQCNAIDLPVRILLSHFAQEAAFGDSFGSSYEKELWYPQGVQYFTWLPAQDAIRATLTDAGVIEVPVGTTEYLLRKKRTRLTGACRL